MSYRIRTLSLTMLAYPFPLSPPHHVSSQLLFFHLAVLFFFLIRFDQRLGCTGSLGIFISPCLFLIYNFSSWFVCNCLQLLTRIHSTTQSAHIIVPSRTLSSPLPLLPIGLAHSFLAQCNTHMIELQRGWSPRMKYPFRHQDNAPPECHNSHEQKRKNKHTEMGNFHLINRSSVRFTGSLV